MGQPACVRPVDVRTDFPGGNSRSDLPGGHSSGDHNPRGNQNPLGDHKDRPYGTSPHAVGRVIQAFKSITTHEYIIGVKQNGWPLFQGKLWQRNYYEHIIRNEKSLHQLSDYIKNNPLFWNTTVQNKLNFKHRH